MHKLAHARAVRKGVRVCLCLQLLRCVASTSFVPQWHLYSVSPAAECKETSRAPLAIMWGRQWRDLPALQLCRGPEYNRPLTSSAQILYLGKVVLRFSCHSLPSKGTLKRASALLSSKYFLGRHWWIRKAIVLRSPLQWACSLGFAGNGAAANKQYPPPPSPIPQMNEQWCTCLLIEISSVRPQCPHVRNELKRKGVKKK